VLRFEFKSHQTLALNNAAPDETEHAGYLAALMGMGQRDLAAQVPLPRRAWLGLAGLLSNARRSAFTVSHVLSEFVGAKITLEQLVGAWQLFEPDNRIALGRSNHRLGQQSVLGRRMWDQQARVRLTVAALAYPDFCRLLPPNDDEKHASKNEPAADDMDEVPAFTGFVALMRLLLDRQCDCEVQLQADPTTVPPSVLSAAPRGNRERGLRLGQTAWLSHSSRFATSYKAGYLVRAFDAAGAA
jgi:type VI secretion system protein ImpH